MPFRATLDTVIPPSYWRHAYQVMLLSIAQEYSQFLMA